jgi:hypothetical protein
MDSRNCVKRTIDQVEVLTGCRVQIVQDSSIKNMAVLDIARGPMRLHRIRIHPNFGKEADYLTSFECAFILRKFAVPPEKRFDFAAKGRRDVEKTVSGHYANKQIPADVIRGLADQLFNGLMFQLISIPVPMRVDAWVTDSFPDLVDQQKTMVTQQLQDALGSLKPEVRKIAPYPNCSTDCDPTLVVGWAGWNHLEQATALAAHYDARKREGWDAKRLTPLLAGLDQLLRWIHQWHPEVDPEYGETAGQSFETVLEQDAHELGLTLDDVRQWTPPEKQRKTRTTRKKKAEPADEEE